MNSTIVGTCAATGVGPQAEAGQPGWAACGETLEVSNRGLEVLRTLDAIFEDLGAAQSEPLMETMST